MSDLIYNFYLHIRYALFKRLVSKKNFGTPTFVEDFNNPSFIISDNEEYNTTMVMKKENVEVKNNKLLLHTKYEDNKIFSSWWGSKPKVWSIGWVDFPTHLIKRGAITVKCKLPSGSAIQNWAAIWCLRERHADASTKVNVGTGVVNGRVITCSKLASAIRVDYNWNVWFDNEVVGYIKDYSIKDETITVDKDIPELGNKTVFISPDHITPEIDIMEMINGKIQTTVHYGYSITEYRTTEWHVKRGKAKQIEYEFGVEILDTGYKFYIDGVLIGVLTDKKSITEARSHLILNNAKQPEIINGSEADNNVFEISEVKFYNK